MAMEDIVDAVRRIIHKWVNTISPIVENVIAGTSQVKVHAAHRFEVKDQVMFKNDTIYETGKIIDSVDTDTNIITFDSPILNNWTIAENTQLIKTINELFVQGIYIGEPDVIPRYPAICVNGISRSSEWMTLETTKERFEIEVTIFVKESTHEAGYRFLLQLTDMIQKGLKRNLIPLVNDYEIVSLVDDITNGDAIITIENTDEIQTYKRILIEDKYQSGEYWIQRIYAVEDPSNGVRVHLYPHVCGNYSASNTSIIIPRRFVFNSWPATIEYGKIHKGELLKASVIRWFAEEEELQDLRYREMKLN